MIWISVLQIASKTLRFVLNVMMDQLKTAMYLVLLFFGEAFFDRFQQRLQIKGLGQVIIGPGP